MTVRINGRAGSMPTVLRPSDVVVDSSVTYCIVTNVAA